MKKLNYKEYSLKVPDVKPSDSTTKVVCSRFTSTLGILRSTGTYFVKSSLNTFRDIFSHDLIKSCEDALPSLAKKCQFHKEFEDTKGVIKIRKSKKNRQRNGHKRKRTKGQTTIFKAYT